MPGRLKLYNHIVLTTVFGVHPVGGHVGVGHEPGDVAVERLTNRIFGIVVREVHGDVHPVQVVVDGERAAHARVLRHLFGRRIILDHVPRAHQVVDAEIA